MQQRVYQVHDVDELKQRLIDVWHGFEQSVINDAGDKWRKRLCVKERNFRTFNLTPYSAHAIFLIIFVTFVTIKQELLCYVQQNFANFALTYFTRYTVSMCGKKYDMNFLLQISCKIRQRKKIKMGQNLSNL